MRFIFFTLLLSFSTTVLGQIDASNIPNTSTLSIPQIMQGEKFVGYLPENIQWSEDSETIYFTWNPNQDTLRNLYKVNRNGGTPRKVSVEEQLTLPSNRGDYNERRDQKVYAKNGDIFLLTLGINGNTKQITNTIDRESNPQFSGDEQYIVFQSNQNLYTWRIADGVVKQLTNFQKGDKKKEMPSKGYEEWLGNDQLSWFEILQERKNTSDSRKYRQKLLQPQRPSAVYYGDKRLSNLRISPDLKFVTYRLTKRAKSHETKVPHFVTESGKVENKTSRSKVGAPQDSYELGVYNVAADSTYIVDTKQIEGIYDKPAFLKAYHKGSSAYKNTYDKPRDVILHGAFFSEDGKAVIVVRSMDNKDRWILSLDLVSGKLKTLDRQRDEAWVGGPGISGWNFSAGNIGWLEDNQHIWFQSEESGYSHLYTVNVNSGKKRALTKGDFEIIEAQLSKDKKHFYITSNQESPHERHFYKLSASGGKMVKITGESGNYQVTMSPDENYLAIRYSYSNKPWELYVMVNSTGSRLAQLTESTTADFKKYDWRDPAIVRFKARDGVEVPARIYQPEASKKNGAAVIFVHGAGYLQNVHKWWSSYYREYMFHQLLVDNGYTVLDIDYRASQGYGRDWRTGIYQFMGGKDLEDNIDGAKYLVEQHGIDSKRIGIYGGSYGGFITLMGLFTSPGTFKSGAALRSVTDWAHYNHPYTSNILNTPAEDSLAFYKSSPIYHAKGLQDNLLILHGMVDANVQFQDVVRLAQRLIELEKDDWEFAVFPMERHGFVEPSSWTDEYKRIFKLFQTTLQKE